jgi:hypothetical protein
VSEFPAEDVLIARGKYSTLASERRAIFKALRGDMEAIVGCCQRALRIDAEEIAFTLEQTALAKRRIDSAVERLAQAALLTHHLEELKPLAWGQKEPE